MQHARLLLSVRREGQGYLQDKYILLQGKGLRNFAGVKQDHKQMIINHDVCLRGGLRSPIITNHVLHNGIVTAWGASTLINIISVLWSHFRGGLLNWIQRKHGFKQ